VKYSDAGEPRGTAELPVLSAIKRRELYDVVVVVVRIFWWNFIGQGQIDTGLWQGSGKGVGTCTIDLFLFNSII